MCRGVAGDMRAALLLCWLAGGWLTVMVRGGPAVGRHALSSMAKNLIQRCSARHLQPDRPLILVSELSSRLDSLGARAQDARLPLPSPQELDSIRKVAQILIMLGEQVIPAIIGEPTPSSGGAHSSSGGGHSNSGIDVPNDGVSLDKLRA